MLPNTAARCHVQTSPPCKLHHGEICMPCKLHPGEICTRANFTPLMQTSPVFFIYGIICTPCKFHLSKLKLLLNKHLTANVYKNSPSAGIGKKSKFFDFNKIYIALIYIRNHDQQWLDFEKISILC